MSTVERPYQVCLYIGPNVPALDGVRVVDLTPAEHTPDGVIAALRNAEISPADLRSRVLFVADGGADYLRAVLMTYAALIGFTKRRVDVGFGTDGEAVSAEAFDQTVRTMPGLTRPDPVADTIQVGGPARDDIPHLDATALTPTIAAQIRFSRRLRFVPPEHTDKAVLQLVALAALRARGTQEKLPALCDGTEPAPTDGPDTAGIDLNAVRRAAEELRRSLRSDNRDALAEPLEHNPYQRLADADSLPVEDTLVRLGASSKVVQVPAKPGTEEYDAGVDVETVMWHCPRPERHTNGDANPSARIVVKGETSLFQCYRCDPERVGSLRLVMDTLDKTGTEAANWLLDD